MRIHTTALLATLALTATACSDDAPTGVSSDEAAVQQAYFDVDAGFFEENPGGDDILEGAALRLRSDPALPADVQRVHDPRYLSRLERRCAATSTLGWLDSDTYITHSSFDAAMHAAESAIAAVERSLKGEHCFALIRAPGHHAEFDRAMGFCLINIVAVAAKKALEQVDTIAIVDWDAHHGNGTQNSFYGTDRVLYCSVHKEHFFPYTGTVDETGAGDGRGYTVNAPLQAGSAIADYHWVFSEVFVPVIERFSPDVMIVSAGQDILFDDPIGMMNIRPQDFEILTRTLTHAAGVPLALVLEGGYSPSHGEAIHDIFNSLMSDRKDSVGGVPSERTQTPNLHFSARLILSDLAVN